MNWYVEALKKYAVFSGRSRRKEYWFFVLFNVLASIVLAAVDGGKVQLAAGVTADATARMPAGELVNFVAQQVGGKGGGRADLAMAGGTDPSRLGAALASVQGWVGERT